MVCEGLRVPGAWVSLALDGTAPDRRAHSLPRVVGAERAETRGRQPAHSFGDGEELAWGLGDMGPWPPKRSDLREGEVGGSPDPGHQQVSSPESSQHHVLTPTTQALELQEQ